MKAQEFPDLEKLFYPKTIAVIGASTDPEKIGGRPLSRSIKHGTKAKIYAVNPRAANGNILGFLSRCYDSRAEIKGAAVMEMLTEEGVECIVGTHFDADFGWTLMFGLGGIFVEIIKDVSMRVVPLSRSDAESMITEVKGYQLLKGARGQKEKDIKSLTDFMLKTSQFLENYGDQIKEFEINPLIILPKGKGVFIADCLMALK